MLGFLHRDPHGTVFAHYIRPNGKLTGTRQFGHLTGPCGDLRTRRRLVVKKVPTCDTTQCVPRDPSKAPPAPGQPKAP